MVSRPAPRILVVEDEPGIALGLEDTLRLEGYEVEVAGDGLVASERTASGRFDLIVLDLMLPGRSGLDVCRELRRRDERTPVILLTARGLEEDRVCGLDAGANDYVTKPFSPRELAARALGRFSRAGGAASRYGRVADVTYVDSMVAFRCA